MGAAEQRKKLHDLVDELPDTVVAQVLSDLRQRVADKAEQASATSHRAAVRESTARMIETHDTTLRKLAK